MQESYIYIYIYIFQPTAQTETQNTRAFQTPQSHGLQFHFSQSKIRSSCETTPLSCFNSQVIINPVLKFSSLLNCIVFNLYHFQNPGVILIDEAKTVSKTKRRIEKTPKQNEPEQCRGLSTPRHGRLTSSLLSPHSLPLLSLRPPCSRLSTSSPARPEPFSSSTGSHKWGSLTPTSRAS